MKSAFAVRASRAWGRRTALQSVLDTASNRTGEYAASDPRCDPSLVFDEAEPDRVEVINNGFSRRGGQLSAWTHRQEPVWTQIVGASQSFQQGGRSLNAHELGRPDSECCLLLEVMTEVSC